MKKVPQRLSYRPGPVRLYREDVEEIVDVFANLKEEVKFSNSTYHFDHSDEWLDLKADEIKDFRISSSSMELTFRPRWITMDTRTDSDSARSGFYQIKEILDRCERKWITRIQSMPFIILLIILPPVGFLFGKYIPDKVVAVTVSFAFISCVVAGLLMFALAGIASDRRYTLIIPKYRRDAPNFFKANSEKILLAIVSAAVGAVISTVSAYFFGRK